MGGVKKGAFDEAEAERRLDNWMTEKDAKIQAKIDRLAGDAQAEYKKQLAAEIKVNEAKAAVIAAKNAPSTIDFTGIYCSDNKKPHFH